MNQAQPGDFVLNVREGSCRGEYDTSRQDGRLIAALAPSACHDFHSP
jgi:hypothetical protein